MSLGKIIVHVECPNGHLPHSVNFLRDIQQIGVMQKIKQPATFKTRRRAKLNVRRDKEAPAQQGGGFLNIS